MRHSYQVPNEVGKIGTESPTFVQPVQDRKDGIQAMFAKQQKQKSQPAVAAAAASTNPTLTQRARKRSASPTDLKSSSATTGETPAKKPKVEKLNTWEDDSDVEYVDDPPAAGGDGAKDHKARLHVRTPPRRLLILPGPCLQPSATSSASKRGVNHPANDAHGETPPKVSSLSYRVIIYAFWSKPLTSMFAVTGTERRV